MLPARRHERVMRPTLARRGTRYALLRAARQAHSCALQWHI
jgi:hypothetical protein